MERALAIEMRIENRQCLPGQWLGKVGGALVGASETSGIWPWVFWGGILLLVQAYDWALSLSVIAGSIWVGYKFVMFASSELEDKQEGM